MSDDQSQIDLANCHSAVDTVMKERHSVRAFLPKSVSKAMVAAILETAAYSPSGTNIQPWQVIVVAGDTRQRLCERVLHAHYHEQGLHTADWDIYPAAFVEPFLARRRKNGFDLYGLLGIAKGDKEAMNKQFARNYTFFDAPVGLIFTIDRRLVRSSWLDYGMFMQNIMLAARARGLDTCPQIAWSVFHQIITEELQIPEQQMVVCGMALGYADSTAVVNSLVTDREPLEKFVSFRGF